ncbi:MAG: LysM domain-containing protein [Ilumatobacteraceae bacterium]
MILEGDYPSTVAPKFKVSFEDLEDAQRLDAAAERHRARVAGRGGHDPDPGRCHRSGRAARSGPPSTTIAGSPVAPTTVAPATTAAPTTTEAPAEACGTYTVVDGDYPGLVAQKLNTTVAKLAAANTATRGYGAFYIGLVINVPC